MKTINQRRAEIIKEICGIAKHIRPEQEIKDEIAMSIFNYEAKMEALARKISVLSDELIKLKNSVK